jgi:single-stranded DNA-binding protein
MTSRNFFVISGNVSQKPRQFSGKAAKTVVTVAVDEFWTDQKSGEKKKRTEFLTAYTFNAKIGGFLIDKVNIGDQITIDGHIRANSYDKGGEKIYTQDLEIVRLDAHTARADHVADDVAA